MLDGNGDGIPGDSYVLHFSTVDQDLSGPIVTQYFPDSTNSSGSFDVEGVVTVLFDELINSATINHNNVILKAGATAISKDMQLKTIGNQSIINIKTQQSLLSNTQYSLTLTQNITDVVGNPMPGNKEIFFTTSEESYSQKNTIDDFTTEGNWEQPEYSGSTVGVIDSGTSSGYSTDIFSSGNFTCKRIFHSVSMGSRGNNKIIKKLFIGRHSKNCTF